MACDKVWFVDANLHRICTAVAGLAQSCFHERTTEAAPASSRYDVQLREVALETAAPDRLAKAENPEPVGTVADEQNDGVRTAEQMRDSLRQYLDHRCRLIELAVEVVQ